jgi:predicted Zn-dependent peptidase
VSIPDPGHVPALRLPRVRREVLDGGLAAIAARRRGVPMIEVRLRIPIPTQTMAGHGAKRVLARTLLSGTRRRSDTEIAAEVQETGGSLSVGAGADAVAIAGSALAGRFDELLAVVGDVLAGAAYPRARVRNQRDRLAQELVINRSNPQTLVRDALARRMYGTHPYGLGLPTATAVARAGSQTLRALHARSVVPDGATLTMVGDIRPAAAIEAAAAALAGWRGGEAGPTVPAPEPPKPGPITVVHRPGAVQTNIRLGAPAPARTHPDYPALTLAELVFGGYFGSRLSANIREDKGYSYSPRSAVDHRRAASRSVITANVAAAVTAPALVEILFQTQAGLAGQISRLVGAGLDERFLRDHPRDLDRVTPERALAAAQTWLRPADFAIVLLGDADVIRPHLEALGEVLVVDR